jgi:tripartite-type tricarboxylate transporter receptor subunit TctC
MSNNQTSAGKEMTRSRSTVSSLRTDRTDTLLGPIIGRATKMIIAAAFLFQTAALSRADDIEDFYRNKTVTIVIGAGDGGFYDLNARLLAQFMRKYVPGNPTVIVQLVGGASQARAAEHAANIAPRDGRSLLVVQPYVFLNKVLDPQLRFDPSELSWIGRIGPIEMGGVTAPSVSATIADAMKSEIILGANAPNGPQAMIPWALNRLAGTKFRVVRGFRSQNDTTLAMNRGEVQGIGNVSLGSFPEGIVRVLYVSGLNRLDAYPHAPTIVEIVKDQHDKPVISVLAAAAEIGLTLAGSPQIPTDRLGALRRAFDLTVKDPDYIANVKKLNFAVNPMSGEKLAQLVRAQMSPSEDIITRLKNSVVQQ